MKHGTEHGEQPDVAAREKRSYRCSKEESGWQQHLPGQMTIEVREGWE